jgi:hypothetical protein
MPVTITPVPSFTLDAAINGSFGFASSAILLPGTPGSDACVRVTNMGPCPISIALGTSTVAVTQSTGLLVMAGQSLFLTLGTATYIAGVACGGPGNSSTVNVATGS